ncbi:hypothetical protein PCANC_05702 [Puccinia coronata f. sp. avenae]|uniref:Uncharacterized protein n=1 Tax=Puccinia coronata f. sp. avenae TaxID=200324 RepID=A0A2N5VXW1_9BASI|nr:hypothetical protein PCASD_09059 [Puccinia coronata f. sp. avenae]PLW54827.1 hypothetical protein PCANC_05702 [Puccinia coronata f. sp. avenae]
MSGHAPVAASSTSSPQIPPDSTSLLLPASGAFPVENKNSLFNPPLSNLSEDNDAEDPKLVSNQPIVSPRTGNTINWDLWTPIATSTKHNPVGPVKDPVIVLKPYVHRPPPTRRSRRIKAAEKSSSSGTAKTYCSKSNKGLSKLSRSTKDVETYPLSTNSAMRPSNAPDVSMDESSKDPTLDFLEKQFPPP